MRGCMGEGRKGLLVRTMRLFVQLHNDLLEL